MFAVIDIVRLERGWVPSSLVVTKLGGDSVRGHRPDHADCPYVGVFFGGQIEFQVGRHRPLDGEIRSIETGIFGSLSPIFVQREYHGRRRALGVFLLVTV